jgi:hypothetical protein
MRYTVEAHQNDTSPTWGSYKTTLAGFSNPSAAVHFCKGVSTPSFVVDRFLGEWLHDNTRKGGVVPGLMPTPRKKWFSTLADLLVL